LPRKRLLKRRNLKMVKNLSSAVQEAESLLLQAPKLCVNISIYVTSLGRNKIDEYSTTRLLHDSSAV